MTLNKVDQLVDHMADNHEVEGSIPFFIINEDISMQLFSIFIYILTNVGYMLSKSKFNAQLLIFI